MLKGIAESLGRIGTSGSFATRRSVPGGNLRVEVQGVGSIRFPITAGTARKLTAVARPARHGFRDQTRLDPRVRDTWEIPGRRIAIGQLRWQKTLLPELDRIRRDLGLPEGCRLEARLHNLLIYAPGQFFVTHQDSEKTDDMIGTLVVSLPSRFTGGEMVIEHHDERKRYRGSDRYLTLVAFYGDCRHEVRPVKQGYRVALTYNLMANGEATGAGAAAASAEALVPRVREFFAKPGPPRWKGDRERDPPDRLVYLLDHDYTQRGLAWNRLKAADAQRAAVLKEVARQLDCEILLALADVHETWACEDAYPDYRSGWDWEYDDEEDGQGHGRPSAPELTELIDRDVELRHWVADDAGSRRRPKGMASSVDSHELCYTKPSVEFEPFESEHEGYMGNWGNTVDHWYHRAAVVLWPRERTFIIRAKASPEWAMGEIAKLVKAGKVPAATEQARRLLPSWPELSKPQERSRLLGRTLEVTVGLEDKKIAAALLDPFSLTDMTPKLAPRLVGLLDRYGEEWCARLVRNWLSETKGYEPPETRLTWMGAALPALCRALCGKGSSGGQALAHWALMEQWSWVREHMRHLDEITAPREHLKEFSRVCRPMLALLESSVVAGEADLHGRLIEWLTENNADIPVQVRLAVLRAAHQRLRLEARTALGLSGMHTRCMQELATRLQTPVRARDDWSIATPIRCSCRLCGTLVRYLRAPHEVRLEWPLAKAQRAHVHGIIDAHDLSVRHATRRTGRPYTLVLEKTPALFERDAAERRTWQNELAWLTETAGNF